LVSFRARVAGLGPDGDDNDALRRSSLLNIL
jgi:hypothetical protein